MLTLMFFHCPGTQNICIRWNAGRRTCPTRRNFRPRSKATNAKVVAALTEASRRPTWCRCRTTPSEEFRACRRKFRPCRWSPVIRGSSMDRRITECHRVRPLKKKFMILMLWILLKMMITHFFNTCGFMKGSLALEGYVFGDTKFSRYYNRSKLLMDGITI